MIKTINSIYNDMPFNRSDVLKKMDSTIAKKIYRNMVRFRCFDEKVNQLIQKGHHMSHHSSRGEEATPAVATIFTSKKDYLMPYHRGNAWVLGKGIDPGKFMAEFLGKKTGTCKGKGGPQAGFDAELNIMGRPGIQGAHLSISVGIALAIKKRKGDQICLSACGDGATNTGYFHEALNMAAVWKVPIIFFVENNLYAIKTIWEEAFAIKDIAVRGLSYGIPGIIVDGNDAVALYSLISDVIPKVRQGQGPVLIEAKTYRWDGHNTGDFHSYGGYRTKAEVNEWKEKCPIIRFEKDLLKKGYLSDKEIKLIWNQARKEMEEAAEYALNSPYPEDDEYFDSVYC